MTTAQNDEKNIVQSLQESCDAYMLKPIHRSELLGHIRKFQLV
jgi:DNA-binding response OmpR family regulator